MGQDDTALMEKFGGFLASIEAAQSALDKSFETHAAAGKNVERLTQFAAATLQKLEAQTAQLGANTATPVVHYVHTDHLGRPVRTTSPTGTLSWWAVYAPFGTVHATGGALQQDMRFPGQWFQLETGLAYNWNRHYDATLGRYVQPDPIGYDGGRNLYGYVEGNPLVLIDLSGLKIIRGVPPGSVAFRTPNGECFFAPPGTDWSDVYYAGRAASRLDINDYVGHYGRFDFQRSGGDFYPAYTDASNYAVGVYMNGNGWGRTDTLIIGQAFGALFSRNRFNNNWSNWWSNGWDAASNLSFPESNKCGCSK